MVSQAPLSCRAMSKKACCSTRLITEASKCHLRIKVENLQTKKSAFLPRGSEGGHVMAVNRRRFFQLTGATAHAAQPDTGRSPAGALSRILEAFSRLHGPDGEIAFATVVGARLGERAYGTAPGSAEIWVTLLPSTSTFIPG